MIRADLAASPPPQDAPAADSGAFAATIAAVVGELAPMVQPPASDHFVSPLPAAAAGAGEVSGVEIVIVEDSDEGDIAPESADPKPDRDLTVVKASAQQPALTFLSFTPSNAPPTTEQAPDKPLPEIGPERPRGPVPVPIAAAVVKGMEAPSPLAVPVPGADPAMPPVPRFAAHILAAAGDLMGLVRQDSVHFTIRPEALGPVDVDIHRTVAGHVLQLQVDEPRAAAIIRDQQSEIGVAAPISFTHVRIDMTGEERRGRPARQLPFRRMVNLIDAPTEAPGATDWGRYA